MGGRGGKKHLRAATSQRKPVRRKTTGRWEENRTQIGPRNQRHSAKNKGSQTRIPSRGWAGDIKGQNENSADIARLSQQTNQGRNHDKWRIGIKNTFWQGLCKNVNSRRTRRGEGREKGQGQARHAKGIGRQSHQVVRERTKTLPQRDTKRVREASVTTRKDTRWSISGVGKGRHPAQSQIDIHVNAEKKKLTQNPSQTTRRRLKTSPG